MQSASPLIAPRPCFGPCNKPQPLDRQSEMEKELETASSSIRFLPFQRRQEAIVPQITQTASDTSPERSDGNQILSWHTTKGKSNVGIALTCAGRRRGKARGSNGVDLPPGPWQALWQGTGPAAAARRWKLLGGGSGREGSERKMNGLRRCGRLNNSALTPQHPHTGALGEPRTSSS